MHAKRLPIGAITTLTHEDHYLIAQEIEHWFGGSKMEVGGGADFLLQHLQPTVWHLRWFLLLGRRGGGCQN